MRRVVVRGDASRCDVALLPVVFLGVVEQHGRWPAGLATGFVSLIPNGEGSAPEKLQPISVMSVLYRLWAATRLRDLIGWQEGWVPDQMHGFRPAQSAEDVWWPLALKIERALLEAESLSGISLDYSKCFDRVPVDIVLRLADRAGIASAILRPVRAMFVQLRRHFQVCNHVGVSFCATTGILQGCPLSVVLVNLLVSVWVLAIEAEVPGVDAHGCAGDTWGHSCRRRLAGEAPDIAGNHLHFRITVRSAASRR